MKSILLLILAPLAVFGQTPDYSCYNEYRNKGIGYMENRNYGEAISQFVAALVTCKPIPNDNDLSRRIEDSKKQWANDLQKSVKEAQILYEKALESQKVAENAKVAEESARKRAEENAQNAFKKGVRAESFRLALLADMARQQGKKTDALLLSWMGLQLSDTMQPYLVHSFGEAVRDSFSRACYNTPSDDAASIESVSYLFEGQYILIKTTTPVYTLVSTAAPFNVTRLSQQFTHVEPDPKAPLLAVWGSGNNVYILNVEGKTVATLSGHTEGIRSVAFSPDGQKIATASRDNTAKIWDLTGKEIATLSGHGANVQSASFSPDGSRIITRSSDGTARIWDATGLLIKALEPESGHIQKVEISKTNVSFVQLSNGKLLFFDEMGNAITGKSAPIDHCQALQASTDKKWFGVKTGAKSIQIFDDEGIRKCSLDSRSDIQQFSFTTDSKHVSICTSENVADIWDLNGKLIVELAGHRKKITNVEFNPEKGLALTSSEDGSSKLWDLNGNLIAEWLTNEKSAKNALFSPDMAQILSISKDGKSISTCPLPMDVYKNTNPKQVLSSNAVAQAKKTYTIQFLDIDH